METPSPPLGTQIEPVSILIVDDEEKNLDALESILDAPGQRVVKARTADEALIALLRGEFAVIVLDIKMPDVNGFDLAKIIKQRKRSRHTPILFLTAYMLDERDVLQGYDVGGVDYLTKPITPAVFRSKVGVFIDLFRTTRALAAANFALESEIGERRRAQEALRLVNEELDARVQQRTIDLTKANESLLESEERLRLALFAGGMGLWSLDLRTRRVSFDEAERKLLRLDVSGNECSIEEFYQSVHAQDMSIALGALEEFAEGRADTVEIRILSDDGDIRWLCGMAKIQHADDGSKVRLVGIHYDVTMRKRAEATLREREAYFREVTHSMPHIVWTSLPDGMLDFVNRRWHDYTGQTLEQLRSSREAWFAALHDEDRERVREAYFEGQRSGEGFTIEGRLLRASDHSYRWHLNRCVPLREAGGKIFKFLGTCTDIHEQKLAQEALREADARKDEFLATLAHELRNPLAPIRNGLQIMKLSEGNKESTDQAMAMMERQLGHMVHLIDDLFDVSRINRGKLELRKQRIELTRVLQSAVESSMPLVRLAGHRLTVHVAREPVYLEADHTRLAQVFSNLLNNAAKFTDACGHIEVTAGLEASSVVIKIKDSGIGMSPEMLSKVFEPFVQVDRSLERTRGGLGIGLTLVRSIVELHGGTVEAWSAGKGLGSEFIVKLPAMYSDEMTLPQEQESMNEDPGRRRVVVADDNKDSAESLFLMLRLVGNEVRTAHDGLEAFELVEAFRPDAALLDIGMPRLNGYEVARRIRAEPWGRRVLLIALTGWGQEEDRRRSSEAGFDHHLVKPVDPVLLQKLLVNAAIER